MRLEKKKRERNALGKKYSFPSYVLYMKHIGKSIFPERLL